MPIVNGVDGVLMKAFVYLFPVQLNDTTCDVLGAFGADLRLDRHLEERDTVDMEQEDVFEQVIAEDHLPLEVTIL